jgi:hypothetical protein
MRKKTRKERRKWKGCSYTLDFKGRTEVFLLSRFPGSARSSFWYRNLSERVKRWEVKKVKC